MQKNILVLFTVLFLVFSLAPETYGVVIDEIVATVNGEPITLSELEQLLRPVYARYENIFRGEELERYKKRVRSELLNQLIENTLIRQRAEEEGVTVSEATIAEELADVKNKFGSLEKFKEVLKEEGMTYEGYKDELKEQLTIRRMMQMDVLPKVRVGPEEIKKYYKENTDEFYAPEEVHIKHIMVEGSKEEIENIYKQLEEGKTLEDKWVDLGFIPRNKLKPELGNVVDMLDEGEYSKIIETKSGYYIIKLEEHKISRKSELNEVWESVEDKIFKKKLNKEHANWVNKLKNEAHIELSD